MVKEETNWSDGATIQGKPRDIGCPPDIEERHETDFPSVSSTTNNVILDFYPPTPTPPPHKL